MPWRGCSKRAQSLPKREMIGRCAPRAGLVVRHVDGEGQQRLVPGLKFHRDLRAARVA